MTNQLSAVDEELETVLANHEALGTEHEAVQASHEALIAENKWLKRP